MRLYTFALLLGTTVWPAMSAAQNTDNLDRFADTMVRLCVGGGHTETVSEGGSGGANLSLRSLDVTGDIKGEIKVDKSTAEGLVAGINNAMSQVAANEADKVRDCLAPVRARLMEVMLPAPPPPAPVQQQAIPKYKEPPPPLPSVLQAPPPPPPRL